jgi:tRNA 2-selenouridine synthase
MNINQFLAASGVILDVRSPAEYDQGRIPGAINLPLFSNEERAAIGTVYKQLGKEQAISLGLRLVGPRLAELAETAKRHAGDELTKIHCWRGGMRSGSVAWLLQTVGLPTATLRGGYKAFRRWVLNTLQKPARIHVIGGLTGSGKTRVLHTLQVMGEQVLDLEALAHHRGSSYGMLEMPPQPSTEQFENEIAARLATYDSSRPVWVEDESRMIGTCKIPDGLFQNMLHAPIFFLEKSHHERVAILLEEYGFLAADKLSEATERLEKRIGRQRALAILNLIGSGKIPEAIAMALEYYDKAYTYGLSKKKERIIQHMDCQGCSAEQIALNLKLLR